MDDKATLGGVQGQRACQLGGVLVRVPEHVSPVVHRRAGPCLRHGRLDATLHATRQRCSRLDARGRRWLCCSTALSRHKRMPRLNYLRSATRSTARTWDPPLISGTTPTARHLRQFDKRWPRQGHAPRSELRVLGSRDRPEQASSKQDTSGTDTRGTAARRLPQRTASVERAISARQSASASIWAASARTIITEAT